MATSPNYSWPEPDNTDLVKNGALAIRTMGNAIDTTMATMTPKSTYTAKGSIAAATAASTPANLSVGANDTILVADSTAATGLAWKSNATQFPWVAYSPTISGLTLGNGTISTRYQAIGKTYILNITVTLGSTSAITGDLRFALPTSANKFSAGSTWLEDVSVGVYTGTALINTTDIYVRATATNATYGTTSNLSSTVPFTWATGDNIIVQATFEAA
jgi:hypothetical protein